MIPYIIVFLIYLRKYKTMLYNCYRILDYFNFHNVRKIYFISNVLFKVLEISVLRICVRIEHNFFKFTSSQKNYIIYIEKSS